MPTDANACSDFTAYTKILAILPPSSTNPLRTGITSDRNVNYSLIGTVIKNSLIGKRVGTAPPPPPAFRTLIYLSASTFTDGDETWTDASGIVATGYGAPVKNTDGHGIVLNGNTYFAFPNIQAGNAWTVSMWYKQTDISIADEVETPPPACIVTQILGESGSINFGFGEFAGASNSPFMVFGGNNGEGNGVDVELPIGVWRHITVTWDGMSIATYANGELLGVNPGVGISEDSGVGYVIGRTYLPEANSFVVGEIGELRILSGPLNPDQVLADYNSTKATFGV